HVRGTGKVDKRVNVISYSGSKKWNVHTKGCQKYSVPKSTLNDRVTGTVVEGAVWGKRAKFDKDTENGLVDCAFERSEMGSLGALAKEHNKPFKKLNPSDMWWRRFKERNQRFSLRTPEATMFARAWLRSTTKNNVQKEFKSTGIYPLNRAAISEEAYKPSEGMNCSAEEKRNTTMRDNKVKNTDKTSI
ncbi:hypothetical protein KUTeg_007062, partial [Tegillarca granosa]